MRTSFNERLTEWAVTGFLWGFRILIVLMVVLGTYFTARGGNTAESSGSTSLYLELPRAAFMP